ncbi:hypothetical protein [Leadbettera azotonutricia]|uniref:Uncharacterized protein n=1 Tax=Leadbettera azotonutricia (strain ATCC BAA-888 / DSM 13862 / ZAS-9) TaxID=545695 RepID=F5YAR0_LEAAZ|nr:hypothetical protein [Leadbettera azotonutricia]AEF80126.1 hypothetical protein TREAZ_1944 [Leadbettera azotonutricia ZAS-9]
MSNFFKGVITGAVSMLALVLVITVFRFFHERDRKLLEYVEVQNEIQAIEDDYRNRDPYEFFETTPGVRGAADSASEEFNRKRNEAIQRIRDRHAD